MGELSIRVPLKREYNPYPLKWRLPGDKTSDQRQAILGWAKRSIVHALTYYEIPPMIDEKIELLPPEEEISRLSISQKDYLSFLTYTLKQMVAAQTMSAETAWGLFFQQWRGIHGIKTATFELTRQELFGSLAGTGSINKIDLLKFEFYMRAGEAGLRQFEQYDGWAKDLVFDRPELDASLKQEYRKALWLEMRLAEQAAGLAALNQPIGRFECSRQGTFEQENDRGIVASIDLFSGAFDPSPLGGRVVDSLMKSEIGHWQYDLFDLATNWAAELMDRMNFAGYTPNLNEIRANRSEPLPPFMRVFLSGGYFKALKGAQFPTYPDDYNGQEDSFSENHCGSEYVDQIIRRRLVREIYSDQPKISDIFGYYKKLSLYVALLNLAGWNMEKIVDKIEVLNIEEIGYYHDNYSVIAQPLFNSAQNDWKYNSSERLKAEEGLVNICAMAPSDNYYSRLQRRREALP